MALTTLRKQEARWSLEWSRNLSAYPGFSYTSFMEYCRFHGRTPPKVESGDEGESRLGTVDSSLGH